MNVLWVAQDNNRNGSFKQTKAEVLCTTSCAMFVKHYYPEFKTNLFVDRYTKQYYEQFGVLDVFDVVNDDLLEQDLGVNLKVYWAAGKLFAQNIIQGPTLTLDLDFRFYSDIEKFGVFNSDITCLWVEDMRNECYMTPENAMSYTNLKLEIPWDYGAFNTSFLYIKNDDFRKKYCEFAIQYMKSNYNILPSDMSKIDNNKFIMFVEQYMLKQFSNFNELDVKVLIDDFHFFPKTKNSPKSCGISMVNSGQHFYHYGDYKTQHMVKKDQFCLNEIEHCNYITNKIVTNDKHLEIFNKIYKIDINERCFC